MNMEDIYQKYPWLQEEYKVGTIYDPMVGAVTGKHPEINPMDYFEAVVTYLVKVHNYDPYVAVNEVKSNVGYYAGYFSIEAMQKVKQVYGATHPIFW